MPFYSHKDYLLTSSPVKYSLLFTLRQKLERGRFLLHVRAVENSLAETLFSVVIQNRTVFFHNNNSVFGVFNLANLSSWQKLIVSFDHKEISVTQECAEFSFFSIPNKPELHNWEEITVTVQTDNTHSDNQVNEKDRE